MGQLDLFGHEVMNPQVNTDHEKIIFETFYPLDKPKIKTLKMGHYVRTQKGLYVFLENRLNLIQVNDYYKNKEYWLKVNQIILCGSTLIDVLYKGDKLIVYDYDGNVVTVTFEQKVTKKKKTVGFSAIKQNGQLIYCKVDDLMNISKLVKPKSFVFVD